MLRSRSFDLANEARQMGKMAKLDGARFAKTTANFFNSFCHFHLTLSVSRPQRPLIVFYMVYPSPEEGGGEVELW